jgi:N-acetylglucosamine kinase-like BadF-type ATPase
MLAVTDSADVAELLEKVMRWQAKIGGEFAPQVFDCAREGDAVAQSIVRRAGETIGQNVNSVARELGMTGAPFDLVLAGGVFSSRSELLYESLSETIRTESPRVELVHWKAPPVVGALLLALDTLELSPLPDAGQLADQIVYE